MATSCLYAGPAPYRSAKIYILTSDTFEVDSTGKRQERTAQNIRDWADIVIEVRDSVIREWFEGTLHWENAKHDPSIKKQAEPLIMVIDLYDRVQPEPPVKPRFDTLYCSRRYAYSDEGDYLDITQFTSKTMKLPLYDAFKSQPWGLTMRSSESGL